MNPRIQVSILLLAAAMLAGATEDLGSLSRAYRKAPNVRTHAALLTYAKVHSRDGNGALALLAAAEIEMERNEFPEALAQLASVQKQLPALADYVAYTRAMAEFNQQDYPAAARSLAVVFAQSPKSPLVSTAAILAAHAALNSNQPKQALEILKTHYSDLTQPAGDFLLASAFDASGDAVSAATYYQRVYYNFPASSEADQASSAIARLRDKLGDSYPTPMPQVMLARALKLIDAGSNDRARQELDSLVQVLGGTERDMAKIGIGAVLYQTRDNLRAYDYLKSLVVTAPQADAERLYYMVACASRLNNQDDAHRALDTLAHQYPVSKWRLEALLSDANTHLVNNEVDAYQPLYRACYESFPNDPRAAVCQWRVAWGEYMRRRSDAAEMLKDHLRLFPKSNKTGAALYFLGRLAEADREPLQAKAYYEEIRRLFPNDYYAILARQRLSESTLQRVPPSTAVASFLQSIPFREPSGPMDFRPDSAARLRIERARLLATAGLDDWADGELRFGAKSSDRPYAFALELAALASRRSAPDQAIWSIASLAPGYLYQPLDAAPARFWRLAYPLPYRADLERYARQRSLDPYLVAAVVRQESSFNPKVVSHANAYGLTQILPSTGRELSRKLRVRAYSTRMLFQPALNLQLGTFYLRSLLDQLDGKWAATLASYNAGKSRALNWLSWGEFREPAEFVETIPFNETRSYVQIVLRNADIYRRIYARSVTGANADDSGSSGSRRLYPGALHTVPSSSEHSSRENTGATAGDLQPAAALPQPAHPAVYRVGNSRNDAAGHRAQSSQSGTGLSRLSGPRSSQTSRAGSNRVRYQSVRHHVGSQAAPGRHRRQIQTVAQPGA